MAMGHGGAASGRAIIEARHLVFAPCLVDEDDPPRIEVELPFKPSLTRRVHRVAALFSRVSNDDIALTNSGWEQSCGSKKASILPKPLLLLNSRLGKEIRPGEVVWC
jgi:hypothetical protein